MIGTGGMCCRGALRGIEAGFGPEHGDTFRRDLRAYGVRSDSSVGTAPVLPA